MPDAPPHADTHAMFRVQIRGSIEDVWQEITRTDAPIAAFFNSRMEAHQLARGSRLAMRSPDGKYTGVVGEILEYNPPTRFVHTFQFTQYDDPPCTVAYDLEQIEGTVQFTLTVTDMSPGTKTAKQMRQGGPMIVNTLQAVIETGRPTFGTRLLFVSLQADGTDDTKEMPEQELAGGTAGGRESLMIRTRPLLLVATVIACAVFWMGAGPAGPQDAENPLAPFERLIGGQWHLEGSYQEFEWGVGKRSIRSRAYFMIEGKPKLVSEGSWFWHPGEKQIKGVFTAIDMPIVLLDYTTRFEGNKMVNDLLSYDAGGNEDTYVETWEFIDDKQYVWKLMKKTAEGLQEVMGGNYSKK